MTPEARKAIDHVLIEEGGYVDHPKDPGGATNRGITLKTLEQWRGAPVSKDDVRNLSEIEARQIYHHRYWSPIKGDQLPAKVAFVVMDAAVNSGVSRAIKWLQEVSGCAVDGQIGPKTIAAVKAISDTQIVNDYCDLRLQFLQSLPTWPTFGKGWARRVSRVREHALTL